MHQLQILELSRFGTDNASAINGRVEQMEGQFRHFPI
jgi:hypothetical protein